MEHGQGRGCVKNDRKYENEMGCDRELTKLSISIENVEEADGHENTQESVQINHDLNESLQIELNQELSQKLHCFEMDRYLNDSESCSNLNISRLTDLNISRLTDANQNSEECASKCDQEEIGNQDADLEVTDQMLDNYFKALNKVN